MSARIDRRTFVMLCSCAPLLGACAHVQYLSATATNGRLAIPRTSLATLPFAFMRLESSAFPIYVARDPKSGEFSAVLTRCMHRGCQVEPAAGHLICPCHGSEYTNAGEIIQGPTALPLIRFKVEGDEDNIFILTDGVPLP